MPISSSRYDILADFRFAYVIDIVGFDLQDATQQLVVLPEWERDYTRYLDREFLKAYEVVECRSGSDSLNSRKNPENLVLSMVVIIMGIVMYK